VANGGLTAFAGLPGAESAAPPGAVIEEPAPASAHPEAAGEGAASSEAADAEGAPVPCDAGPAAPAQPVVETAAWEPETDSASAAPEPAVAAAPPVAPPAPQPPVVAGIAPEDHEAALAAAREAAWAAGRQSAIDEMQQAVEAERAALRESVEALRHAVTDTGALFAPLKRLSLHLAEQLVRGELALSGESIRRLVDGCLAEVDPREAVALRLNPEDLAGFRAQLGADPDVTLTADAALARGSVRVELTDGWVEDLIEDRLDALSRALLDEPWTPKKTPGAPRMRPAPEPKSAAGPRLDARPAVDDDEEPIYAEPLVPRDPLAAYREEAVLEHEA
jgi:flagellar biosynthesis/type III secretory pathway protein FliH